MSARRIRGLGPLLLLLGSAAIAHGQTIPSDATGFRVPCAWIDDAGNFQACSTSNPMPYTPIPPNTPASDPTGFGRQWFSIKTPAVFTGGIKAAGFFLDGSTAIAFQTNANLLTTFRSPDAGRTWAAVGPATAVSAGPLNSAGVAPNGNFLISTGGGILVSVDRAAFTVATITGAAFVGGNSFSFFSQGATTLVTAQDGNSNAKICRSTSNGVTYNCVNSPTPMPASFTISPTGQGVASPAASIWLVTGIDGATDRTFRSTDDGITWTQVDSFADGGSALVVQAIACPTATICLQSDNTKIRRSTDAGLTWTTVQNPAAPVSFDFNAFLLFGQGVVVAAAKGSTGNPWWRSTDNGATWTKITPPANASSSCLNNGPTSVSVNGGRALIFQPNAGCAFYTGGSGGVYNSSGQQVVGQGDGGIGTQPWTSNPMQGTTLFNSQITSAANTADPFVCTGATNQRCTLRGGFGSISAAGTCSLLVQDGATTIWASPGALVPLTSTAAVNLFPGIPSSGLTASAGNSLTVTVGACGVGVTSTAAIFMDRQ